MGYTVEVRRATYRPSKWFIAVLSAFFVLSILFFALPELASFQKESVTLPPFPVTVDPKNKTIAPEEIALDTPFLAAVLVGVGDVTNYLAQAIMSTKTYQGLAVGSLKSVVIPPGMRKEQIAGMLDRTFDWSSEQKQLFLDAVAEDVREGGEGHLYPSTYIFAASTTPAEAYDLIRERFNQRVLSRYSTTTDEIVPLKDALTIASIIEREAGNEEEMRIISGILWNRLFKGMRLQADSTLSYARGTAKNGWWPVPRARDKYIKSPYNTYQNEGLPPAPIASPSVPAIMAALNPEQTDCYYFFHAKGQFYCHATYEDHVAALKKIYGRGR